MNDHSVNRRYWIPLGMLSIAACVMAFMYFFETDSFNRQYRVLSGYAITLLTLLVCSGWLLFISKFNWFFRFGLLAGVAALFFGSIRRFDNQGDMIPRPEFRWERTTAEIVSADRSKREKAQTRAIPAATPEDFPEFRNLQRDGAITGPKLARDWSVSAPKELWRQPAGEGYAGFSVVGPVAFTIEQRGNDEAVVCYDSDTGRECWVHTYAAAFRETLGGDGPRTNPTVAGDDVFSLGATGVLLCLDAATGKVKWRVEILGADNPNIQWGMSGSPLVVDQMVIVNPGAQSEAAHGRAVLALDRSTGNEVWTAGARRSSYVSPMVATLAGVRQLLIFDGAAVAGLDLKTGKELWNRPWEHSPDINVGQPLVIDGDKLFVSSGYDFGCGLYKLSLEGENWKVQELWRNKQMKCKFTSPVYRDGYIYGLDDGILACIDLKAGKRQWKDGRYGHGQILIQDDLIIVGSETGKMALVEASPKAFKELASIQALAGPKNWNHITISRGRAYWRNHKEMVAYELPLAKS